MNECEHPRGCCRAHAEFYEELGRAKAEAPAPLVTPSREVLAEALSWLSGEMTRWSESAHRDHNRWSWRGDGHGDVLRDHFIAQAAVLIASGVVRDEAAPHGDSFSRVSYMDFDDDGPVTKMYSQNALADAWDEGYLRGTLDNESDLEPADNPYREASR